MGAADLIIKLGFDNSTYQRGLAQSRILGQQFATGLSHEISSKLQGAFSGGAVIAGLEEFGRAVVENVSHIKDLSEQSQLSTDDVQRIGIAAAAVGLKFEDFQQVLFKVQAARKSAVEGNEQLMASLTSLGFSQKEVNDGSISSLEFTKRLVAGSKEHKLSAEQEAEVLEVLGIRSGKLISVIQELNNIERKPIIDPKTVEDIDRANKQIEEFGRISKVLGADVIGAALRNPIAAILSGGKTAIAEAATRRLLPAPPQLQGPDIGLEQFGKVGTRIARDGKAAADFKTDLDSILKLQEAASKLDFAKLSSKEKELKLQREINSLIETANGFDELSLAEKNKLLTQAEEKKLELFTLQSRDRANIETDPLVRSGNFLGSRDDRPVQKLDIIARHLQAIQQSTADTTREIKERL